MKSIGIVPLTSAKLFDHLNPQPDGTVTVSMTDGTVFSCQPDGSVQYRPAGAAGIYEKCVQDGVSIVFTPGPIQYWFAFTND